MKQFYYFLVIFFIFGFTSKLYSQSVPSYVPTNGLMCYWPFNGNTNDESSNGNNGNNTNSVLTSNRLGNSNSAYYFDGNSRIYNNNNALKRLVDGINPFTVTLWFNRDSSGNTNGAASAQAKCLWAFDGNNVFPYKRVWALIGQLNDSITQIQFTRTNTITGSPEVVYNTNNFLQPNTWHFLAITFNGNSAMVYIDNIQLTSIYSGNPIMPISLLGPDNNISGFTIGDNNQNNVSNFSGILDDIGIWNRALTPQEITNLYNSQLPNQTSLCLPTITTNTPTSIGIDSVIVGGNITNDGGSSIVLRGVCYSTTPNPNMGNMRTEDGSGVGSFSTILRNLNPSTTYYVRSYAKNTNGVVVYGDEVSFSTGTPIPSFSCGTSTVYDVDGNNYNTVQIGNQCWTQSNLKVSKYRNGDNIPTGLSNTAWENTTAGAYAIYDNNPVNDGLYGKLYNHYAVMDTRGLCPTGWHVPTDGEWTTLETFLGGSSVAGGALKSTATLPIPGGWNPPNTGATNSSGFSAGPGGWRYISGYFSNVGIHGHWWSSSLSGFYAWSRYLHCYDGFIYSTNSGLRTYGFSVRCLRD